MRRSPIAPQTDSGFVGWVEPAKPNVRQRHLMEDAGYTQKIAEAAKITPLQRRNNQPWQGYSIRQSSQSGRLA
jgi:hypothetical protein